HSCRAAGSTPRAGAVSVLSATARARRARAAKLASPGYSARRRSPRPARSARHRARPVNRAANRVTVHRTGARAPTHRRGFVSTRATFAPTRGPDPISPTEPFLRHALPFRRTQSIVFGDDERSDVVGVLVDAADGACDPIQVAVVHDAVA